MKLRFESTTPVWSHRSSPSFFHHIQLDSCPCHRRLDLPSPNSSCPVLGLIVVVARVCWFGSATAIKIGEKRICRQRCGRVETGKWNERVIWLSSSSSLKREIDLEFFVVVVETWNSDLTKLTESTHNYESRSLTVFSN